MGNETSKNKAKSDQKTPTAMEIKTLIMMAQKQLTLNQTKKVQLIKQKRSEAIMLLKQKNLISAKGKMESIIREEDLIAVFEILTQLCDNLKDKVTYMLNNPECPSDLRASLDTLIYASPRMELGELAQLRQLIIMKYKQEYVTKGESNADGLVNVNVVNKLKLNPASDSLLILRLKQIWQEEKVQYNFPDELIEGEGIGNINPYGNMNNNPYGNMNNNPYSLNNINNNQQGNNYNVSQNHINNVHQGQYYQNQFYPNGNRQIQQQPQQPQQSQQFQMRNYQNNQFNSNNICNYDSNQKYSQMEGNTCTYSNSNQTQLLKSNIPQKQLLSNSEFEIGNYYFDESNNQLKRPNTSVDNLHEQSAISTFSFSQIDTMKSNIPNNPHHINYSDSLSVDIKKQDIQLTNESKNNNSSQSDLSKTQSNPYSNQSRTQSDGNSNGSKNESDFSQINQTNQQKHNIFQLQSQDNMSLTLPNFSELQSKDSINIDLNPNPSSLHSESALNKDLNPKQSLLQPKKAISIDQNHSINIPNQNEISMK